MYRYHVGCRFQYEIAHLLKQPASVRLLIPVEQLERLDKETVKDEALKETLLENSKVLEEARAALGRQQENMQVRRRPWRSATFSYPFPSCLIISQAGVDPERPRETAPGRYMRAGGNDVNLRRTTPQVLHFQPRRANTAVNSHLRCAMCTRNTMLKPAAQENRSAVDTSRG